MPVDPLYHSTLCSLYDQSKDWQLVFKRTLIEYSAQHTAAERILLIDSSQNKFTKKQKRTRGGRDCQRIVRWRGVNS